MASEFAPPLRERLAALGGLTTAATMRPRPRLQQSAAPTLPTRAAELGFAPVESAAGTAWTRRVGVELAPFLRRAGVGEVARPDQLVRLALRLDDDVSLRAWRPDQVTVLDIESLGLHGSGVTAFLVGTGSMRGTALEVDQHLLIDLDAEAAMLDSLAATLEERPLLITYNGRTFDLPVLAARCVVNRRRPDLLTPRVHCDLLAPVRRLFRERLGACTLRQAELQLLGLDRGEDVPGYEAPARYGAWLRGGPASLLEGVVRHNQFDLCATMVLAARLVAHVEGDLVRPVHPADRYHLGVHLASRGIEDAATAHLWMTFSDGDPPWSQRAGHRLAHRLRRIGSADAAHGVWSELRRRHPDDLVACRALAIAAERRGDLDDALRLCEETEALLLHRRQRWGRPWSVLVHPFEEEWGRRGKRLRRRLLGRSRAAFTPAGVGRGRQSRATAPSQATIPSFMASPDAARGRSGGDA
ncbi:MAG: ribonuclease H-like domain-containing protein [Candidatus Dormibacteria bacterium]